MTHNARQRFRATSKLKLRDKDADDATFSSRAANPKLTKARGKALDLERTAALIDRIAALQDKLYAQRKQKVLLILQGMDTSGKDGTVRAMFSGISPMGLRAVAFKAPTDNELAHDYLWRVHQHVPMLGEIAIFNRSHYEDVLITRVQEWIDDDECKRRYAQIRDFERMLAETGTVIVKVFLHISKEEQRERLQERLDDPDKQWKFNPEDIKQRAKWDDYQRAYEKAIRETNAPHAPWYVVPANSKTHRNLVIASLLLETLEGMDLSYPAPHPDLSSFTVE
ncbi:polyphosphate:nucleotide phosphotransferase, PPK2 family [Duganella sp. CF402]|uniref:polyphosphate kinase 2 family protein n=1 Tax=unclassified Duganella TaxID=2636909 RepID=UPI0008AE3E64|nr:MULTISPECIES: polyphosphate kinase 2 family protein [unclassified Duganella]RZT05667.1 PPK2 family polyphosphate:nucleotide phosphotransferase [Duganella sp. BK701]SEM95484.1 polyphosphate:nucleotide phosphotransferase, PPK2 family [Duganella sp. CF402]